MSRLTNLTRQRFGRLIVLRRVDNDKSGNPCWLCQCDCGKKKIVRGNDLKSGDITSCRCLQKEKIIISNKNRTKHGHAKNKKITTTYYSWRTMIQRCTNKANSRYKDYGGRGITVCER